MAKKCPWTKGEVADMLENWANDVQSGVTKPDDMVALADAMRTASRILRRCD